jgi:photosystem II stability/assembly factor-like uncharacterized protein
MTDERLAVGIRDAFESTYVPSLGLEERVVSAIPWDRPADRATTVPRLAGVFATTVALLLIVVLAAPTILSRLNIQIPGSTRGPEAPAYSLAAVSGGSVYVVQRTAHNDLLQSRDGGRTWTDRLHFGGVYDGAQIFGADGFIWSIDMQSGECRATSGKGSSCVPPSYGLTMYRSVDGGSTWSALPVPAFPVEDVFFLDASLGWAVSSSPTTGVGVEALYATADGGASWTPVGALPRAAPNGQVFGVGNYRVTFSRQGDGSLRGWYVGATQLYVSTDAGRSWQPVAISAPAPVAAWAVTPAQPAFAGQEGILPMAFHDPTGPDNATANRVYIYVSHDGGSTWIDPRPAPAGFAPVGDVISTAILDSNHIWLTSLSLTAGDKVQARPAVARTSDGGLSWTVAENTPRILEMTFGDAVHGYALDVSGQTNVNGILSTSDSGATWQRVDIPLFTTG